MINITELVRLAEEVNRTEELAENLEKSYLDNREDSLRKTYAKLFENILEVAKLGKICGVQGKISGYNLDIMYDYKNKASTSIYIKINRKYDDYSYFNELYYKWDGFKKGQKDSFMHRGYTWLYFEMETFLDKCIENPEILELNKEYWIKSVEKMVVDKLEKANAKIEKYS